MEKLKKPYLARISQPILKHATDLERNVFAESVLNFINPKFSDEVEFEISKAVLLEFAIGCELTAKEFLYALELASDQKLVFENEKGEHERVKLFREIDRLKLGEVKSAYIYFRTCDASFNSNANLVTKFLAPPPPELTPEQKLENTIKTFKGEYARLLVGELYDCYTFYNLIIASEGITTIKLSFIERILEDFEPVKKINKGLLGDIVKVEKTPKNHFKESVVFEYVLTKKLLNLSLEEWVVYWVGVFKRVNQ